jgi:HAD superfamily hydrolase (TIGR01509 family)
MTSKTKPVRGVLLDIDGTLVESNDAHARAWVKALAESGRTVAFDAVRPLIGMGGDKLLPKVCGLDAASEEGKKVSERRGQIFIAEYLPHLKPCHGAEELLARLKKRGLKMAVASSAKEDELGPLLKICGADKVIESAASSDDAKESKPDPDILHAALEKVGLPADEVVMLGDTPYDVEAARKAGTRVVALRCGGWTDADLKADAVFADPADLAKHLESSPLVR